MPQLMNILILGLLFSSGKVVCSNMEDKIMFPAVLQEVANSRCYVLPAELLGWARNHPKEDLNGRSKGLGGNLGQQASHG